MIRLTPAASSSPTLCSASSVVATIQLSAKPSR